jgi:hypothetical protein
MVYICFSPSTFSFRFLDIRFDYRYFNANDIYSEYGSKIRVFFFLYKETHEYHFWDPQMEFVFLFLNNEYVNI